MKKYRIRENSIADYAIRFFWSVVAIVAMSIPSTIEYWMGWL